MTDQYCQLLGHKTKDGKCVRCQMWIGKDGKEHLFKPNE